jgi:FAD/FMN-containing dehydrogenase
MSALTPGLVQRLCDAAGPGGWSTDPDVIAPHLVEPRGQWRGASPLLLRPVGTAQVAAILKICSETGTKVVPQGGNTGLVGGSIPFERGDEVVLSLARMNRVRAVQALDDSITVEAGCTLAQVQQAAIDAGRLFPMRIASEGTCQIGGNLSTNAGGTAVLRYGNTRDLVLGLEVVLPDGTVWDGLRALRKDNTGYDLKHLFIGAEGTLGVITAAVLKLYPLPKDRQTAFVAVRDVEAAVEFLGLAQEISGGLVTGFELMSDIALDFVLRHMPGATDPLAQKYQWYVLVELSGGNRMDALRETMEQALEAAAERGLAFDAVIATSDAQARALWRLREDMSEAQKPEGGSIKHDISVPKTKMAEFIRRASAAVVANFPGARPVPFGHVGDGNVHFNVSQPVGGDKAAFMALTHDMNIVVHDIAAELGGSISAEHGLGRLKREEILLYKSALELDLMRRFKAMLDPRGIMNPGKVL